MGRQPSASTPSRRVLLAVIVPLILILGLHTETCSAVRPGLVATGTAGTEFIRTSCRTTEYPELCFTSLAAYAPTIQTSPLQLAHAALNVSLTSAKSTAAMMMRLSSSSGGGGGGGPMSDCAENMAESVTELQQSVDQMDHFRRQEMGMEISDVQTWVSAALTEATTCVDGFVGGGGPGAATNRRGEGAPTTVRTQVLTMAHLTSNALALINALVTTTTP